MKENSTQVRVVLADGNTEVMTLEEAEVLAEKAGLDLVYVNENGDIPVVKIMDYNKLVYEENKRAKEQRKKQHINEVENKEIKMNYMIATHDMMIKANQINKLLTKNYRVTITVKYKGRAVKLLKEGENIINKLLCMLTVGYKVVKPYYNNENQISIVIVQDKKKGK